MFERAWDFLVSRLGNNYNAGVFTSDLDEKSYNCIYWCGDLSQSIELLGGIEIHSRRRLFFGKHEDGGIHAYYSFSLGEADDSFLQESLRFVSEDELLRCRLFLAGLELHVPANLSNTLVPSLTGISGFQYSTPSWLFEERSTLSGSALTDNFVVPSADLMTLLDRLASLYKVREEKPFSFVSDFSDSIRLQKRLQRQ